MSTICYIIKAKVSPEVKGETLFLLVLFCCLGWAWTWATSAATASAGRFIFNFWWEKFGCRELNSAEKIARIIAWRGALFRRNTEIISRNKHLNISFNLNYSENSKRDRNGSINRIWPYKLTAETPANWFRDPSLSLASALAHGAKFCARPADYLSRKSCARLDHLPTRRQRGG